MRPVEIRDQINKEDGPTLKTSTSTWFWIRDKFLPISS